MKLLVTQRLFFGLVGGRLRSGCWYFAKPELRMVSSCVPYTLAMGLEGLVGCCEYSEALQKPQINVCVNGFSFLTLPSRPFPRGIKSPHRFCMASTAAGVCTVA